MKEPERKEGEAVDARVHEPQAAPDGPPVTAPKAYAFDGWSMVPLEPESV